MTGLVTLDSVSAGFQSGSLALDRVTLSVQEGAFMGIVGPSGAGKTTLLKVLAGAVTPSAGAVKRHAAGIGYVPQVDSIRWDFPVTAMEVLLMASRSAHWRIWGKRSDREAASELLHRLGLEHLSGRHIKALSGGQQQRVFIARALMGSPRLLLLDEPTSNVDVATRHDVLHLLHDLNHRESIAVVMTTHDLNGIASHMHQVVCLNRTIIASGSPEQIMTPEILEATYGAPMDVLSHGGMPVAVESPGLPERYRTAHHEH